MWNAYKYQYRKQLFNWKFQLVSVPIAVAFVYADYRAKNADYLQDKQKWQRVGGLAAIACFVQTSWFWTQVVRTYRS